MSTLATRRFSNKVISAVAAIVTAIVVSAALAVPALASPNDPVAAIDGPNHTYQFGGGCASGAAPAAGGNIDWRENGAQTTVAPRLTGDLCLQNTMAEFRVALEYRDNAHALIGRYTSSPATGNGSALNTFAVNVAGPRLASAAMNHVHVQIQQRIANQWQNVGPARVALYP
jgi:hypothetical protein